MDMENENVFVASGSHDQHGRHAHMVKHLQKSSSLELVDRFHETWYVVSGTLAHQSLFK